jgi:hypothetical protein
MGSFSVGGAARDKREPSAKRQPQRRIVAFNEGFGEVFAVIGKDGEVRGGIEGNRK